MALAIPHRDPEQATTETTAMATLGGLYHYHDATYGFWILVYAQMHGAADSIQYGVAELSDQGLGCVTVDRSDDQITGTFGGICCEVCDASEAEHLYLVVSGRYYVATDGGVSAADPLVPHTVDNEADTMAAGEEHLVFGMALTADTTPAQEYCTAQIKGL